MLDVDQQRRIGGAKIHRRQQRLAAGKHHGVGVAGEQADGVFESGWRLVAENGGLHQVIHLACSATAVMNSATSASGSESCGA